MRGVQIVHCVHSMDGDTPNMHDNISAWTFCSSETRAVRRNLRVHARSLITIFPGVIWAAAGRLFLASVDKCLVLKRVWSQLKMSTKLICEVQMNIGWRYYLISKLILSSFIRTCILLKNIFLEIFSQSCSLWTDKLTSCCQLLVFK